MITVFGSINVDLVTPVERLPEPGETVLGKAFSVVPGGKGANQALAAARAGAAVRMVGSVGRDAFAETALAALADDGVDLTHVARRDGATGCAVGREPDHHRKRRQPRNRGRTTPGCRD